VANKCGRPQPPSAMEWPNISIRPDSILPGIPR
jgi:hypothetical protein